MFRDAYELEVTCSSDAALQAYLSGIETSLRFDESGVDRFAAAVERDPEFALAHAALARQLFIHGQRVEATAQFRRAQSLKDRVTQREQDAIDVAVAAANADPRAIQMAQAHVAVYPNDVFVLAHLLGPFGMLAFSGIDDFCAQNVALLDATRPHFREDDWWHMTSRGFFAAEQGEIEQSRQYCERAWSINENGNCAHSLAHMHIEAGVVQEGAAFIDEWLARYGSQSDMRHHLVWHRSLLDLESGAEMRDLLEVFERELDPRVNDPTPLESLCDNASFLWRCHLAGVEVPESNRRELLEYAEEHFDFCGFSFADLHRSMAASLHPEKSKHEKLVSELREHATDSGTRVAECLHRYAKAFGEFVDGAYADAVQTLEPVVVDSVLVGGSNPQRRIVQDTFIEACIRAGQGGKAANVLRGRDRTFSVFDKNLLDRAKARDT